MQRMGGASASLVLFLLSFSAPAAPIPAGFVSWDVTFPGNSGSFDITNQTGPNASTFPDTTFPITTTLHLSGLGLTVHFANGSTVVEPSSYFTLSADGESFNGSPIAIGGTNPLPTSATLTGTFSPVFITLNNGTTQTILSSFSATISPSAGTTLADGDFAIINATTTTVTGTPEPGTWFLAVAGFGTLLGWRKKGLATFRNLLERKGAL